MEDALRVLKDPAPKVMVINPGETSVGVTMRLLAVATDSRAPKWDLIRPPREKKIERSTHRSHIRGAMFT